jgi:antibiotic biosynthesis monooxygenase (ABM) superfamily enzyme
MRCTGLPGCNTAWSNRRLPAFAVPLPRSGDCGRQASKSRTAHVAVADSYSTALCQTKVGDGVAFELPSDASASKWKRFVTTWLTVFPVLLSISLVVRTVLKDAPPPLQLLPSSLMFTATLQ